MPRTVALLRMEGDVAEVLVVGSGGREHAIGLSLHQEGMEVYFSQGNAGTAEIGTNLGIKSADDISAFARQQAVDLTVIGPEAPLVDGLADRMRAEGLAVFGPSAEAAKLESSKWYATEFMDEFDIPHPVSGGVRSVEGALGFMGSKVQEWVIKADGLAGGKGVVLPETEQEARDTLIGMFSGELYDGAGKDTVVIQERLHGPEVSVFVVTDGNGFIVLPFSQDHKRLKDNDEGLNTGGMGAYAPAEGLVNEDQEEAIMDIARKTVGGLKARDLDYRGVIYMGLMLAEERDNQPVVIEYNVRFGDPETQVVLPLLQKQGLSVSWLFTEAALGNLKGFGNVASVRHLGFKALTVCLAAHNYPGTPRTKDAIYGLDREYDGVIVHHGGTAIADGRILTAGGRVLYITGLGENIDEAAANAYAAIGHDPSDGVYFDDMQFRKDIGWQVRTRR
jgi:phosphoribosylamine---glycine ligase